MDQVKFFKGCRPQISFGPFLNILTQLFLNRSLLVRTPSKINDGVFCENSQRLRVYLCDGVALVCRIPQILARITQHRGLFRTQSNTYDGAFCENSQQLNAKKLHRRCSKYPSATQSGWKMRDFHLRKHKTYCSRETFF